MGFAGKQVRDIKGIPAEYAYQLRVESGGAMFAAPQLLMVLVRPAARDRAVYQAGPGRRTIAMASAADGTNSRTALMIGTSTGM